VRGFGELETVLMDQLWSLGGAATVREVLEKLQVGRVIAYTTVLSTMDNLYREGHLTPGTDRKGPPLPRCAQPRRTHRVADAPGAAQ
jgi:predicted transcriptional regulator